MSEKGKDNNNRQEQKKNSTPLWNGNGRGEHERIELPHLAETRRQRDPGHRLAPAACIPAPSTRGSPASERPVEARATEESGYAPRHLAPKEKTNENVATARSAGARRESSPESGGSLGQEAQDSGAAWGRGARRRAGPGGGGHRQWDGEGTGGRGLERWGGKAYLYTWIWTGEGGRPMCISPVGLDARVPNGSQVTFTLFSNAFTVTSVTMLNPHCYLENQPVALKKQKLSPSHWTAPASYFETSKKNLFKPDSMDLDGALLGGSLTGIMSIAATQIIIKKKLCDFR